jgi:hypothetical protein
MGLGAVVLVERKARLEFVKERSSSAPIKTINRAGSFVPAFFSTPGNKRRSS